MGMLMLENVEGNSVTNILLMNKENCALKLVDEIVLYYDARLKKHQIYVNIFHFKFNTNFPATCMYT